MISTAGEEYFIFYGQLFNSKGKPKGKKYSLLSDPKKYCLSWIGSDGLQNQNFKSSMRNSKKTYKPSKPGTVFCTGWFTSIYLTPHQAIAKPGGETEFIKYNGKGKISGKPITVHISNYSFGMEFQALPIEGTNSLLIIANGSDKIYPKCIMFGAVIEINE